MNLRMWKGILNSEEATITFPTTLAEVQKEMRGLEEFGKSYGPVRGVGGEGPAQVLNGRVRVDDLNTEAGIQNLNQLAELIDHMGIEKLELLNGALALERAKNLNDVLHTIAGLDQYEIFPRLKTDEDLGHFLVDTAPITGKFSFPKEAKPYLDYDKIGAEQRKVLGGVFTPHGLVKRRETVLVQEEAPGTMRLALKTTERSYSLALPASDKQLEQAKRSLGVEDFAQAEITAAKFSSPYLAELLPLDTVSVEDANALALCLQEMEQEDGELMKFCAALEAEQPDTFTKALNIAMNQDDYERVPEDMEKYGKQVLRRAGADDEVIDTIDGYMDFTRLGEDSMVEDGVRRTEFGLVRRLSSPFPPEPEMGPVMS